MSSDLSASELEFNGLPIRELEIIRNRWANPAGLKA